MRPCMMQHLERDFKKFKELIDSESYININYNSMEKNLMHYAVTWSLVEFLMYEGADIN